MCDNIGYNAVCNCCVFNLFILFHVVIYFFLTPFQHLWLYSHACLWAVGGNTLTRRTCKLHTGGSSCCEATVLTAKSLCCLFHVCEDDNNIILSASLRVYMDLLIPSQPGYLLFRCSNSGPQTIWTDSNVSKIFKCCINVKCVTDIAQKQLPAYSCLDPDPV